MLLSAAVGMTALSGEALTSSIERNASKSYLEIFEKTQELIKHFNKKLVL